MTKPYLREKCWETSDGQIFAGQGAAEEHQFELDNAAAIRRGTRGLFLLGFLAGTGITYVLMYAWTVLR